MERPLRPSHRPIFTPLWCVRGWKAQCSVWKSLRNQCFAVDQRTGTQILLWYNARWKENPGAVLDPITVVLSRVEFKHDSKCQHFCVLLVWGCYCQNSSSFLVCFLLCFSAPCWTFLIQRPGCSYCPLAVDSSIMMSGHDSFDRLDKPAFSWRLLHCLDTFDKSEGRAGNFDTSTFRVDRWGFNCTATTLCLVTLTLDQPKDRHLKAIVWHLKYV